MIKTEQLNIEGKRSGSGFVCHKIKLVNALSRALAERVNIFNQDVTIGRKGLLAYLKALAGSNVVKVIPASDSASGMQAIGKGFRVACGNHQSFVPDGAWLKDKMPFSFCQLHVSPSYKVSPNLGSNELAEALSRVLPFTASDETRPVLQCLKVSQKDDKLTLTATDGYTLGELNLDFETGEAEALINRDDIKALIPALRKAKRVKLSFEQKPDNENGGLLANSLIVDTELIKYCVPSEQGVYPDYEKVFPAECMATASFDTREAFNACHSLLALWFDDNDKGMFRPLILTIADNKLVIDAKEDRGSIEIPAETTGNGKVAVAGSYLSKVLRACGGMVEMKIASSQLPVTFSVDGYRSLIMPMAIPVSKAVAEAEAIVREAEAKAETKAESETETPEPEEVKVKAGQKKGKIPEPKQKRKQKEPVAV